MRKLSLRNLPLSLKISLFAFVSILSLNILANIFFKSKIVSENSEFFRASAEQCLDSIKTPLANEDLGEACALMQKAHDRKLTKFFIIHAGSIPICYAPANQAESINRKFQVFDQVVHEPVGRFDFKSIKSHNYIATVGWLNTSSENYFRSFIFKLPTILFGILISVVVIGIIVFRETRAIKKLLSVFKKSARVSEHMIEHKKKLSGEAVEIQQLWRSAYAIERSTEQLKSEVKFVAQDAQNALRREIAQKGETIPYRFFSAMLRFDMNNYTKTFIENPEATQGLISRLSIEVDELVHRYGGLFYGFAGDEYLVLFRDSEKLNAKSLAFACMRDIFTKCEEVFGEASGGPMVTLKASISYSENVLFEIPNGMFLRGLNLILGQRYLANVSVKDVNKLVVNAQDIEAYEALGKFSPSQTVKLKGIEGQCELHEQTEFKSLSEGLEQDNFSYLSYFRSNNDIFKLLKNIEQNTFTIEIKMKILEHLRSFVVSRIDGKIAAEFLNVFQILDRQPHENKQVLASLLTAAERFLPIQIWTEELSAALLAANCKSEPRCKSEILNLLAMRAPTEKFDLYVNQLLEKHKGHDLRAFGNYLMAKAKSGLDDKLLGECERMLKSKNELEIATGIYATSRIIQTQNNIDPVALSQFDIIPELILRIRNLQTHPEAIVSSRALIELRELKNIEIE